MIPISTHNYSDLYQQQSRITIFEKLTFTCSIGHYILGRLKKYLTQANTYTSIYIITITRAGTQGHGMDCLFIQSKVFSTFQFATFLCSYVHTLLYFYSTNIVLFLALSKVMTVLETLLDLGVSTTSIIIKSLSLISAGVWFLLTICSGSFMRGKMRIVMIK